MFVGFAALVEDSGVDGGFAHGGPVKGHAGLRHLGFAGERMGAAKGHFPGLRGHAGSHDALPHVVHIGQGQMLGGRQVAQEVDAHAYAMAPPMAPAMWSYPGEESMVRGPST